MLGVLGVGDCLSVGCEICACAAVGSLGCGDCGACWYGCDPRDHERATIQVPAPLRLPPPHVLQSNARTHAADLLESVMQMSPPEDLSEIGAQYYVNATSAVANEKVSAIEETLRFEKEEHERLIAKREKKTRTHCLIIVAIGSTFILFVWTVALILLAVGMTFFYYGVIAAVIGTLVTGSILGAISFGFRDEADVHAAEEQTFRNRILSLEAERNQIQLEMVCFRELVESRFGVPVVAEAVVPPVAVPVSRSSDDPAYGARMARMLAQQRRQGAVQIQQSEGLESSARVVVPGAGLAARIEREMQQVQLETVNVVIEAQIELENDNVVQEERQET